MPKFIANLPVCNIVMEACGSANYWSRKFISYGHEVSQISPQHVKPFVHGNKNDKNDARAIVIASQQDGMSTVPIKPVEQQEIQMLHRYRDSLEQEITALSNRIRGYLREVGLFLPQGLPQVRNQVPLFLEDAENELTGAMREMIARIVYGTVGAPNHFKNGRHFAAYLGLVPKEYSSGEKHCLMSISKRGNRYIRSLLIHGGRSVVKVSAKKEGPFSYWVQRLHKERGYNKAAVAVANKNARHMWAIMAYEDK